MRRGTLLDSLGIFGSVVTAFSFIEKPFFQRNKIIFLILGVLTLGIYFKLYIEDKIEDKAVFRIKLVEKNLNISKDVIGNRMNGYEKEVSRIKGWVEAINFFKGKKGDIDPIILLVVLAIVIIIMLALQGKI